MGTSILSFWRSVRAGKCLLKTYTVFINET